jgi:nucleoside-diphosphate-sugar epimerase
LFSEDPTLSVHFEPSKSDQLESKFLEISSNKARKLLGWESKVGRKWAIKSTLEWSRKVLLARVHSTQLQKSAVE